MVLDGREEEDIFAEALIKSERKYHSNVIDYLNF